jgi:hypothetical protein
MSDFLLLGARQPSLATTETSPRLAARDVVALTTWHQHLRRWGLLRAFALPHDPVGGLRACLVVRASGHRAASRLAEEWQRRSGYQVAVLPLCDVDEPWRVEQGRRQ